MTRDPKESVTIYGVAVSPGIAIGKAYLVDRSRVKVPRYLLLSELQIPEQIARFKQAAKQSQEELRGIREQIRGSIMKEHLHILDAHIGMLEDKLFHREIERLIKEEQINAEWALSKVLDRFRSTLMQTEDEYLKSRVADLDFVGQRVILHLKGESRESISEIQEEVIVVATDLSPADTAQMDKSVIKAFVTDMGGRTSHTAIVARSIEIPAVVGLENVTEKVQMGSTIIVDGILGAVVVNPEPHVLEEYTKRRRHYIAIREELQAYGSLPGETLDGYRVGVKANIEMPDEVPSALSQGSEGVGLYRSEFLFLNREDLPTEEEHYRTYREVVEKMAPLTVTIRTLDLGGDKLHPRQADESNPALGLRAIRLTLKEVDVFKTQLRGILRASVHGRVRIMLPMISGVTEVIQTKAIIDEVKEELRLRGEPFDPNIPLGIMIEVPAAVSISDILAGYVDFFSIGTNDLIQYALAIDRVNEHVVYLYEPLHPAVLRMIKTVVDAGHNAGIPVGMCGEMAGEPFYIPILLGLGLDELSMNTLAIPIVKKIIRSVTLKDSRELADRIFEFSTAQEIREWMTDKMQDLLSDELEIMSTY